MYIDLSSAGGDNRSWWLFIWCISNAVVISILNFALEIKTDGENAQLYWGSGIIQMPMMVQIQAI